MNPETDTGNPGGAHCNPVPRIVNVAHGVEFGTDLAQGIWPAFILKSHFGKDIFIRTIFNHELPRQIWSQFTDEFVWSMARFEWRTITARPAMNLLKQVVERGDIPDTTLLRSFDATLSCPGKNTGDTICLVPQLSERWGLENGRYRKVSLGRSLPFEHWVRIRRRANDLGYRVLVVGDMQHTGIRKVEWNELGDDFFFIQQARESGLPTWQFLGRQLDLMAGAKLVVGAGGGGLVGPTFGMPSITVELSWFEHFPQWTHMDQRPETDVLWDIDQSADPDDVFDQSTRFVLDALERRLGR